MIWTDALPSWDTLKPPAVVVLEAEPGSARQERLNQWLGADLPRDARALSVSCDLDRGGLWAGLRDLLEALLPELRRSAPELVTLHDYELLTVVPWLRREMKVRYPTLTDSAFGIEKVRNYPMDRVFRVAHGLVDLVTAWHRRSGEGRLYIACDAFDRVGSIVRMFYHELLRRRGAELELVLILAAAPGAGDAVARALPGGAAAVHGVRLALPPEAAAALPPEEAGARAAELEQRMRGDFIEIETHYPELIRLREQAGRAEDLRRARALAFALANHYGLYDDALHYGRPLQGELEQLQRESIDLYWTTVGNLFNSNIALRNVQEALELATSLEPLVQEPERQLRLYYILGMLHARYLPKPDLAKAEAYLDRGLAALEKTDYPAEEKHFLHVFNRNGLAFVRHRQGRPQEAIELCRSGAERLDAHLGPERHRLHRSVLQYNMAQVYTATGAYEQAVAQYTAAIEMDPYFSEYFNERGSAYMKMGRLEEALQDLQRARELSPPYPEARINLGQCLRLMGRMTEAYAAYGEALDLDPGRLLAYVGRAQAAEALEKTAEAIADYEAALALDPAQPLVLSNLASLYYGEDRLDMALSALDRAVTLAPDVADIYQNRALVKADLGRPREAVEDLRTYLRLSPAAEDRADVEAQIRALTASS